MSAVPNDLGEYLASDTCARRNDRGVNTKKAACVLHIHLGGTAGVLGLCHRIQEKRHAQVEYANDGSTESKNPSRQMMVEALPAAMRLRAASHECEDAFAERAASNAMRARLLVVGGGTDVSLSRRLAST